MVGLISGIINLRTQGQLQIDQKESKSVNPHNVKNRMMFMGNGLRSVLMLFFFSNRTVIRRL